MNDRQILDVCMENSYRLVTGKSSIDDILESNRVPYFLWNVIDEDSIDNSVFNSFMDMMIKYYEDFEMYERGSELLNVRENERNKYKQKIRKPNRVRKAGV